MDFSSFVDWILLLTPIATGYATSAICGMNRDAGKSVKARPPGWVFAVVWPVLYLLIGYSWASLYRDGVWVNILFALNTLALILWIVVYSCADNKRGGLYVLLISVVLALMLWGYCCQRGGNWSTRLPVYLLTPYVGWLIFALLLNFNEVNND